MQLALDSCSSRSWPTSCASTSRARSTEPGTKRRRRTHDRRTFARNLSRAPDAMSWLADLILAVHFAFVLFVVGGLALIWIGAGARWRWVRNPWFRGCHFAAICIVTAEAVLGIMCPLTVWEDALRGARSETSFM